MRFALAGLLLLAAVVVGVWDIAVTAMGKQEDTVSRVLFQWAVTYPILPFLIGVIIGHCFWPQMTLHIRQR